MGIEYDLISDATREGYELGKGPWDDELIEALRASDPAVALKAYLVEETLWERTSPGYLDEIVPEIIAFAKAHPDWRVINDASSDISVVDDEWRAQLVSEGEDPDDPDFPMYRKVGSRYRATAVEPVPEVAIPPVDEATRKEVLDGMRGNLPPSFPERGNTWKLPKRVGLRLVYEADIAPGHTVDIPPSRAYTVADEEVDPAAYGAFRGQTLQAKAGVECMLQRVFIHMTEGHEDDQLASFVREHGGMSVEMMSALLPAILATAPTPTALFLAVSNPTDAPVHLVIDVVGVALVKP